MLPGPASARRSEGTLAQPSASSNANLRADAESSQRLDGRGGYIMAHDGDYADSLNKGYGLTILVAEATGAISPTFAALLRRYARLAGEPGVTDYTTLSTVSPPPPPATFTVTTLLPTQRLSY